MPVCTAQTVSQVKTTTKQAVMSDCIKTFPIGFEKLYYLTLAAANEYNYNIDEIQTKSGYIVFSIAGKRKFLASIIYVSSSKSMLKITPYDGIYNFTTETPQNIFKYVELNQNKTF